MALTHSFNLQQVVDKSTRAGKASGSLIDVVFTKEEERNEARKELMEIVRLIKSRQRDRESKAAAEVLKKKALVVGLVGHQARGRYAQSRSSDRKRSESPRPRRGSSERRRRRRHSSSDR
ncbi:hypothetical protein evm_012677 [Chilo suppressalis]|nr:hypothetical protein evm_012677 [Chilo suppressalis]